MCDRHRCNTWQEQISSGQDKTRAQQLAAVHNLSHNLSHIPSQPVTHFLTQRLNRRYGLCTVAAVKPLCEGTCHRLCERICKRICDRRRRKTWQEEEVGVRTGQDRRHIQYALKKNPTRTNTHTNTRLTLILAAHKTHTTLPT